VEEAEEITNLVMHHWNTIVGALYKGDVYCLLLEGEDGVAHGNDWATGFVRGMHLRHDAWGVLVNGDRRCGSLVPILALYHEHDPDPKLRPRPFTPNGRAKLLADLTAGIVLTYRYFRQDHAANPRR